MRNFPSFSKCNCNFKNSHVHGPEQSAPGGPTWARGLDKTTTWPSEVPSNLNHSVSLRIASLGWKQWLHEVHEDLEMVWDGMQSFSYLLVKVFLCSTKPVTRILDIVRNLLIRVDEFLCFQKKTLLTWAPGREGDGFLRCIFHSM